MLHWPLIPLLAFPWAAAPTVDLGDAPHVVRCGDARPWRAWVCPPRPGFLLAELECEDATEDLDLGLAGAGSLALSLSHRARERALIAVDGPVALGVWSAHGAPGPARLRLTWLPAATPLPPGEEAALALSADAASALFRVESSEPQRCLVELTATDGELTVLDEGLQVLDHRPAGALVGLDVGPEASRYLLVQGAGPLAVRVSLPGKGVKSFATPALDRFFDELAATPDQRVALGALRRNPDFQAIRAYLLDYPGGSPLRLRVAPGLRVRGAERFGSYSRGRLTINPTIEGHTANVQELMDTLIHELIHALLALPPAPDFPLDPAVLDMPRDANLAQYDATTLRRDQLAGTSLHTYLEREYGPSASNPERDYIDVNAAAQRLIAKVITDNLRRTGLGHETLVFANIRARQRMLLADQASPR